MKKLNLLSPEIIDSINNTGKLDEEVDKKLTSVIENLKKKTSSKYAKFR